MSAPNYKFTAQEFIHKGKVTTKDIEILKPWLLEENVPRLSDEQIVIFLLSRNYDLEETKKVIKSFYCWRKRLPSIFNDRSLKNEKLQAALNVSYICVMPKRTDDNYIVAICRLKDTNYRNFDMESFFKTCFMVGDSATIDNPPDGMIGIADAQGAGIMHITKFKFGLFKNVIMYIQEGFQLKLKGVYVLNCNYFVNKMFQLARPFLNRDIVNLIELFPIGTDMEMFYKKYVPKHCLPDDYGGNLPKLHVLHQEGIKNLSELEKHFEMEEHQRSLTT